MARAMSRRVGCDACARSASSRAAAELDARKVDEQKVVCADRRPQRRPQGEEFKEADRIRDELTAMGIELED